MFEKSSVVTDHRRVMPITINSDKLYDTDVTDAAWALIAPMLPAARRGGRPRTTNTRLAVAQSCCVPRYATRVLMPQNCSLPPEDAGANGSVYVHRGTSEICRINSWYGRGSTASFAGNTGPMDYWL